MHCPTLFRSTLCLGLIVLLLQLSPVRAGWFRGVIQGFQHIGRAVERPFAESLGEAVKTDMVNEHGIWEDPHQTRRVEHIGSQITAQCHRQDINYRITILDWDAVNAFAAPAGQLFVTRGLLAITDDNELAAVIAHEVGHISRNHAMQALQRNIGFVVLMNHFLRDNQLSSRQWATLASTLMQLRLSRQAEFEADELAVRYTHQAGYNPRGLISFFEKLEANEKAGGPPFLDGLSRITSTHPPTSERISRAWHQIDQL